MCHHRMPTPLSRRDFVRVGAAGSTLLWTPGAVAALTSRTTQDLTPLDAARAAHRWIRSTRTTTQHGVTWPALPDNPETAGTTLYHGSPGVVLFLAELFHATGDEAARADAVAGADHLMATVKEIDSPDPGLYTGLSGVAIALEHAHRTSGEDRFREGALWCIDHIVGTARPDRGGVCWTSGEVSDASSDIVSGAAGIGLTLLWAHDRLGHAGALDTAVRAADRLHDLGQPVGDGLMWRLSPSFTRNYPNFSHGTGGVAYFLARLHGKTDRASDLDHAVRGGAYLEGVSRCDDRGCAVFHHEPDGEGLFYLSWCHGPAGTARLFHQLATATGDERWSDWILQGAKAIQSFGAPEQRSPGYWNNVSQCCGDAGVGDFFLALESLTDDPRHGAFAERVGAWLLKQASEDADGLRWIQAENRTSPEDVIAQTGWMQGAAGVGAFLLHLDGRSKSRKALVTLPDSPWEGFV